VARLRLLGGRHGLVQPLRIVEALEAATPGIFNTDQGSQFTGHEFTGRLDKAAVRISMDGRGRCFDNIFIERLWRSVKYEEVYLHDYADLHEAEGRLGWYFNFYNHERRHQGIGKATPYLVHAGDASCRQPG
jgi:putative transposase